MAYLIDANVFIQAKNLHYGFDFCPAFWDWLTTGNRVSKLFSIEKVGDELKAGDDQLEEWAKARGASFFVPPDKPVVGALATVSMWVHGQSFTPASMSTFLQGADYYLVAHALAHGHTIVTHETPANTPNRIKIPSVCIPLKVKVMNPYEMLRVERARFVLGPSVGFAPLLTMPVPRRSPYVAIALWPGGQENPLRGVPPTPPARSGRVSFLDVPHGFDEETNASMWKTTEEKVAELMTLPADRPSLYRRAAFVLGATAVEGLAFDP